MNNRKARLLLNVPSSSVGDIHCYNVSNRRRLVFLGHLRGLVKRNCASKDREPKIQFMPEPLHLAKAKGKHLDRLAHLLGAPARVLKGDGMHFEDFKDGQ